MDMLTSLDEFFSDFSLRSGNNSETLTLMLSESVLGFAKDQDKQTARGLFSSFFDVFRIGSGDASAVDLLDVLRGFEENAGTLAGKSRDHYVHSANVFILGIALYSANRNIRNAFSNMFGSSDYSRRFESEKEEFLFSWGMSSLLHDIGYPVEISHYQLSHFFDYVNNCEKPGIGSFIAYKRFDMFDKLRTRNASEEGHETLTQLLADRLSAWLHVDSEQASETMNSFLQTMQENGFVDHGFYSALIVLRWYSPETLSATTDTRLFSCQILNSACAIFLHNAYRGIFQRDPYDLGPLDVAYCPLAYLLILCDELQEWTRESYGSISKAQLSIESSSLEIDDDRLRVHYNTTEQSLGEDFPVEKMETIGSILDLPAAFPEGLRITTTTETDLLIESISVSEALPRLLAENIVALAKRIHADYNEQQLLRNPEVVLEYPDWDDLPDSLKYSNIRQAQTISDKLHIIGCYAAPIEDRPSAVQHDISEAEVELLARYEHSLWMEERLRNGWVFAPEKDTTRKETPYLVPYDDLTEDIKDLDRDTIRNIPALLNAIGLGIYHALGRVVS